jgi:spoIIIJ-associated protein
MSERRNKTSVEATGRSVEDAVLNALRELGLSRDQVEIEVTKPGSRGLLGLLGEQAVVRVTAKTAPVVSPPVERERMPAERRREPAPRLSDQREPPARHRDADTGVAEQDTSEVPAALPEDVARFGAEALQKLLHHMGLSAQVARDDPPEGDTEPGTVLLNITGTDLGALIGRQGETLRDLQFVTNLIVSRHTQHWPSLIVDVEHYKSRRQKSLVDLAKRMADSVRASGQPVALEPMPPHERRFVHLALRDDRDVFTESTGQDEQRKVVILPRN